VGSTLTLLEVQNVWKYFGGLAALRGVGFKVHKGEIVGLIGPNGSGKTTIFNVISGVYRCSSGRIIFNGKDITRSSPSNICKMGIARTFQLVKLFPDMTVLENIAAGAVYRCSTIKQAMEEAGELLEFANLSRFKNVLAGELPLGIKKIVELLRALATHPKLLLIDEMLAGLNPKESNDAIQLLWKIRENGITIIFIEHVMRAVMSVSDNIIVLNNGEKIAEGPPSEIARNEEVIKAYLGRRYNA
jgi:branched-chain amino acid transport system ATP-binding protein